MSDTRTRARGVDAPVGAGRAAAGSPVAAVRGAALLAAALLVAASGAACGNKSPATDNGAAGHPAPPAPPAAATDPADALDPAPAGQPAAAPASAGPAAPAPAGPPATAEARARAIEAALIARGWTEGNFKVSQDGPDIGQWQTFMAFTTNPGGTLVDVWAGPGADRDPAEIVIAGEPLTRAQLRALVAGTGQLRDVARIVVRTAGTGRDLGDPQTGSSKGAPVALEGKLRAPAVDRRPGGDVFVFDVRTLAGGYARVTAALAGDGPVTLDIAPIPQ